MIAATSRQSADPLDDVKLEHLQQSRHVEYRFWAPLWENFRLLFRGGEEFLRAAGGAGRSWSTP